MHGQTMSQNKRRSMWSAATTILTLSFVTPVDAGIDWTGHAVPAEGLRVGSELLEWSSTDGIPTLMHKGQPVVRSTNGYAKPAFTALDTWISATTSAIILQAGTTATKDCSVIYVVESRQPGLVSAHELGEICVAFSMPMVERNEQGFLFSYPPSPMNEATARQWHARTGEVTASKVKFRPESRSTMTKLVSMDRPELVEPLQNEEFFAAVYRLAAPQREQVLTALWEVTAGCNGCSGNADQALYGVAIDEQTAAYAGCGWYMDGARVNCTSSDALAVWDRRQDAFYFATDEHRRDGRHDDPATLTVWPPSQDWSPAARERLEAWKDGRALLTTNRK
jgi:hypothetical protein